MKINILLPHKEKFDIQKASSVSITVKNNFIHNMKSLKIEDIQESGQMLTLDHHVKGPEGYAEYKKGTSGKYYNVPSGLSAMQFKKFMKQ